MWIASSTSLYSFLNFTSISFFIPHTNPKERVLWILSLCIICTTAVQDLISGYQLQTWLWTVTFCFSFHVEFQKIHLKVSHINFHLITIAYKKVSLNSVSQTQVDRRVVRIYFPLSWILNNARVPVYGLRESKLKKKRVKYFTTVFLSLELP